VTATERYKRHGHHPALILVEDNPALAARLERALFDADFEVLQISGDDVPVEDLEKNVKLAQSSGLVIIYSSDVLSPQEKLRLNAVAVDSFFDLSVLQLPAEEPDALRKVLAFLRPLRAIADRRERDKHD
jgi:hypothetical protein